MSALRKQLITILDHNSMTHGAIFYRRAEAALVIVGVIAMLVFNAPASGRWPHRLASMVLILLMCGFLVDAVARVALVPWLARRHARSGDALTRLDWAHSLSIGFELLTTVPMALLAPFGWVPDGAPLLASLWLLRFARYSVGMRMLVTVIEREREPITAVLLLFAIVLVSAAVMAFLFERNDQPEAFGSVAKALWWAITTLSTTGYGDAVPVTIFGRMLGGLVMISGIIVLSLLAGVLATGFSTEMRRRDFLRSWDMVSKVPFFQKAGAAVIQDVANLLRPRDFPAGAVVTRQGQPGDCMYFIVSGEVEILIEPKSVRLGPGDFFGEIALLTGAPRNATIVTARATQLLLLDIADFRSLAASRPELTDIILREAERRMGRTGPS